jgi:TonB family protein
LLFTIPQTDNSNYYHAMTPANRALLRAAADGDTHRLRALLIQGADVNSTNGAGQTPLMLAAAFNRQDVVNLLLKARANVEIQDDLGLAAVDWGAHFPEIVQLITGAIQVPTAGELQAEPTQSGSEGAVPVSRATVTAPQAGSETPILKGLAGAILRDRKSTVVNGTQSADGVPELVSRAGSISNQLTEPASAPNLNAKSLVSPLGKNTVDETLGSSLQRSSDETVPGSRGVSAGRMFEVAEPVKQLSKVEVPVPRLPSKRSWKRFVKAILPTLLIAGAFFGGYRLITYLLDSTRNSVTQAPAAPAAANPGPQAIPRSTPVVSGELAGAELYLPDVEYPPAAEPGQAVQVIVSVRVSAKGIVVSAKAVEADEQFRTAAEKTAKRSAFSPDKLQGKGSFIDGTITYSFASKQPAQINAPIELSEPGKVSATAGGPLAGTALVLVQPDYSRGVRSQGAGGPVTVVVRVDRSGKVKSWRTVDGDQRLRSAAVKAAQRSTFSPDKLPGSGDVVGTITYMFQ